MDGSKGVALSLNLDDESLEILENLAGEQRCTLEEYISGLVRKAIRTSEKSRKVRSQKEDDAPMDAFLPEGVDPFDISESRGLATTFEEVQTRMRFAGTPSLFRENESS